MPAKKPMPSKEEIEELYIKQDMSLREMEEYYGVGETTFLGWLKKLEIKKGNKIPPLPPKEELEQDLYVSFKSMEEIAVKYNVSKSTVRKWMKFFEFPTRNIEQVVMMRKRFNKLKYGSENPMGNQEIKEKVRNTTFLRYGVNNVSQSSEIKEKKTATFQKHYGKNCGLQVEEIRKKIEQTCVKKFGKPKPAMAHISDETYNIITHKENIEELLKREPNHTTKNLCKVLSISPSTLLRYAKKYNYYDLIDHEESSAELEILSTLTNWGVKCYRTREIIPPKEIDIFCPDFNVGIEYNGAYIHRVEKLGENYHYNKSKFAEEKGVFLFHIFSFEWFKPTTKERILKELKQLLISPKEQIILEANSLDIRKVPFKDKKQFLVDNSLFGNDRKGICYGLYHCEELVALISLRKPRIVMEAQYEVSRYVIKRNYCIRGAFCRLMHFFCSFIEGNIAWIRNIAKESKYFGETLGFQYQKTLPPRKYFINCRDKLACKGERVVAEVCDCGREIWTLSCGGIP